MMIRHNPMVQLLISVFILTISAGHSKSNTFLNIANPFLSIAKTPNKKIYAFQGDVVELLCQYTYFDFSRISSVASQLQGGINIKWFRLSNDSRAEKDRETTACHWSTQGIIYSEYSKLTYDEFPFLIVKVSSRLIISNFSESYVGKYRCDAKIGSIHVKSPYSLLDYRNPRPVAKPRYESPSCRSLVNNFNVSEAVDGGDEVTVSLGWDLIPGDSTCYGTNEAWSAILLEWDSVQNIPEFDYSIAKPRNAIIRAVNISCDQCSCGISNVQLDKNKHYQFRLHVTAHGLTDVFGSPIYHYGVEEKPVIEWFNYCQSDSKLYCHAKGAPSPRLRFGRGLRSSYQTSFNSTCNCPSCAGSVQQRVKINTTDIYVCEATNVFTNPRRNVSVESALKVHIATGK